MIPLHEMVKGKHSQAKFLEEADFFLYEENPGTGKSASFVLTGGKGKGNAGGLYSVNDESWQEDGKHACLRYKRGDISKSYTFETPTNGAPKISISTSDLGDALDSDGNCRSLSLCVISMTPIFGRAD